MRPRGDSPRARTTRPPSSLVAGGRHGGIAGARMRERRDVNEGTVTQLPRRRAPTFSIAGRRFGRAVLLRRWAAAAPASLQCTYAEWFDPTVVEVAHAVVGFGDLDAAL